jgi:superfamily II RNA helicase
VISTGSISPLEIKNLILVAPQPLNSEFCITYSRHLNLLGTDYLDPTEIMNKNFRQLQVMKELSNLCSRLQLGQGKIDNLSIVGEYQMSHLVFLEDKLIQIENQMKEIAFREENIRDKLQLGKLFNLKMLQNFNIN